MEYMFGRSLSRFCVILASLAFLAGSTAFHAQDQDHRGRKYKAPPLSARINVTVLKADNGKPIQDAHVIFHPIEGDKDKGALELKTNEDGKISIDVIPIGDTVRLQIIANGYQTYGQDYQVDRSKLSWEVCLRRPGAQYSIYTHHPTTIGDSACPDNISKMGSGSDGAAASGNSSAQENAAPAPATDKPSTSGRQPDPPPSATPPQPQSN
ncbi:conserved hypothetical protein [Candidatus Sulfotelmatomonas gaucii]|uniref:Carboxypeptidase regulatory-like domain-containing protein n=1 Tax=Candidatus Sulfuritelmatomonas gaucii TaxID=2043161 RepID=A0A2N9M4C5_9BACT|nr:conserved hypothetical protein [Candidatus Sulfotelmatomonas gaucii]